MSGYVKPEIETNFSVIPSVIYLFVALLLYGFGFYSIVDFMSKEQEMLNDLAENIGPLIGLSMAFLPFIMIFIMIFLFITLILSFVLIFLMSKIAQEMTILVCVGLPLLLIILGGLIFVFMPEAWFFALIPIGIGVILLAIVAWQFQRIRRAGQFVEFSAQLTLDEPAIILMPIFLGIFSLITGFFMLAGFWEIQELFAATTASGDELSIIGIIAAILFEYAYLVVYLGLYYSLSAGVVSFASDWYRDMDPGPSIGSVFKEVNQVFPVIIKFAFMMATFKMIMALLRSAMEGGEGRQSKGGTGMVTSMVLRGIGMIVISIIGAIWYFLNYFTLISIVQKKQCLTESIKDSARTTWNSLLDVLVGETGYGLVMIIFAVVNAFIWGVTGFIIGFVAFSAVALDTAFIVGIVLAIIFIILGFLPYQIVTMPMGVAFKTFMYSYAQDYMEGFQKPDRLPADLKDQMKTMSGRATRRPNARDPSRYF